MVPPPGENLCSLSSCRRAPKWTIRARTFGDSQAMRPVQETPGPGAYRYTASPRGKRISSYGFSRASTGRDCGGSLQRPMSAASARHEMPGPGHYKTSSNQTRPKSPNHVFGSALRGDAKEDAYKANNVPGPGTYNYDDKITRFMKPVYSALPRRPRSACTNTPGPGAYYPNVGSPLATPPNWRLSSEGHGKHFDASEDVPGPGSYTPVAPAQGGPMWTMRARYPESRSNELAPGPGSFCGPLTQFE